VSGLSPRAIEIIGNALAFLCIALIARNSVWNWPVGVANSMFYIALFYPSKLYGDCILQGVYIVLSVLGVYQWILGNGGLRGRRRGQETERPVTRSSGAELAIYAAAFLVGSIVLGVFLHGVTDTDVPFWDGATTSACLVATWVLAYRKIENWWIWIATNVSYFFLYQHKGLVITEWCQIVFLILSVVGYRKWLNELKTDGPVVTA